MIQTFLTEEELSYLQSFLSPELKNKLMQSLIKWRQNYELNIDESLASEIREACGDQLIYEGLNK